MKKITITTAYAPNDIDKGRTVYSIEIDGVNYNNSSQWVKFKDKFISQFTNNELNTFDNELNVSVKIRNLTHIGNQGSLYVYNADVNEKELKAYLDKCKYEIVKSVFVPVSEL